MTCKCLWAFALMLSLYAASLAQSEETGRQTPWTPISNHNGIVVYSRKVPNSPVVALRAESMIRAPIGKVMSVMDQIERQPEWVPSLTEAREIRHISFYERVVYSCGNAPWPVADREFLVYSQLAIDREERKITLTMKSTEDRDVPVHWRRVRGDLHSGIIVLQSVANDTRTYFSIEIHSDPKGWVPKWVVNLVQTRWPYRYLLGLRAQVAKPDVREHPKRDEVVGAKRP